MSTQDIKPLESKPSKKFSSRQLILKRNLRYCRQYKGYSVGAFAKAIGVSRKKYEDIEAIRNYGCYVSWDVACVCAEVLDVSLDWLAEGGPDA